ncbi:TetR family transcriptional regulator [Solibacillus sp. R5-41]|uniref:TetR/AcrR family transcriptional regulator n=1 Tax=Solibacillus sp. R5-41 TaxID=2048654 RepID=UPI000C125970|nr:TetR/AcrR family transcriptional regulator [Solibacillus sp. R5-41]ATP38891.1 TetR family transcriptional regulator [Solibacillus sp. R5-41]
MEKKEDRRIERTKDQLRQTLKTLVVKNGYTNVRVKDIVETANYNRTTFYVHYDGKDELAAEIIALEMKDFLYEFCKPVRDNPILDLRKMDASGTDVFHYIKKNRSFYDLLVLENTLPNINQTLLTELQGIFQNRMYFLGDQATEINAQYFIHYRSYGIYGFILEWIRSSYDAKPTEMARRIINLLHYHSPLMSKNIKDDESPLQ